MESPITTVKNSLSVGRIIGFVVVAFAAFAIFDMLGLTPWILTPYSTAKRYWAASKANASA